MNTVYVIDDVAVVVALLALLYVCLVRR